MSLLDGSYFKKSPSGAMSSGLTSHFKGKKTIVCVLIYEGLMWPMKRVGLIMHFSLLQTIT